jgi:ATP-dependent Clp protease adaptor protein ClpS
MAGLFFCVPLAVHGWCYRFVTIDIWRNRRLVYKLASDEGRHTGQRIKVTGQPTMSKEPGASSRTKPSIEVTLAGRVGGAGSNNGDGSGTAIVTKIKPQTKKPSLYRVLLLNDDYTPMEFVIHVLQRFFNKNQEDATQIMLHVHQNGVGECGVFTYEIAETKVTQVMDFARRQQHPLQCVMEKN